MMISIGPSFASARALLAVDQPWQRLIEKLGWLIVWPSLSLWEMVLSDQVQEHRCSLLSTAAGYGLLLSRLKAAYVAECVVTQLCYCLSP